MLLVISASSLSRESAIADETGNEFFEKQVRPILAARCLECHSGKAEKAKGGLRLDSRAAAMKGGDTGPAVVPGKSKESLLVDAINYGELYQMPPKGRLPTDEIATLTKWVAMEAPWPEEKGGASVGGSIAEFDLAKRKAEHWCWQQIKRLNPPVVKDGTWAHDPIDRFILSKLEENGLRPSPPAETRTLIRRTYFDLIGLPPSEEALNDQYEVVIDRLLASPRFGERWARHWLDLVRYAESRGHEFDYDVPNAFEYRDYVIRALNADVPYDQFVVEHVAGDLLPQPRRHTRERFNESIIGTGFWFLGEACHSPVDIRKDECDRHDNMLDVFSKTFLGLTVACARCHDHKFDAISQRDYYALAGYLQSSSYRLTRFEQSENDRRVASRLAAIEMEHRPRIVAAIVKSVRPKVGELADELAARNSDVKTKLGVLECDLRGARTIIDYANVRPGDWMTDGPTFGSGPVKAGQIVLSNDGDAPVEVATYAAARSDEPWRDLAPAKTSENDPGRLNSWVRAGRMLKTPTFTLQSGFVHYLIEGAGNVYAAVDSHAMINGPLHAELAKETGGNSDLPTRWITHDLSRYVGQRVHLEFSPKEGEDFRVLMVVEGAHRPAAPSIRPNRLLETAMAGSSRENVRDEVQRLIVATLDALENNRIADDSQPQDRAAIANWLLSRAAGMDSKDETVVKLHADFVTARDRALEHIQHESRLCMALCDGTAVNEHVLIRGNHKTVGPIVKRRMLEAIQEPVASSQEAVGNGRLELARQLIEPTNPLVSRVIVNRVWQHLMGRGIAPSVDNFGVLGEPPTHPELLDYLAAEFVRDGWSIKRLIRRIMLSSTYRQRSGDRERGTGDREHGVDAADPQNLLFHRQNLKRLEGEAIRDAMLAVSGRLDTAMFGPSVPIYLTSFMQGRGRPKESGPLDGEGRRSLYVAVRRNFLSPMMAAFDTPAPFTTIGRRNVSNVPAQALILMNDPFVAEQARWWAKNLLADKSASSEGRIRRLYLSAFGREPSTPECSKVIEFLDSQAKDYGCTADDERVWADCAHVLFNFKEFVFVN
ncbi:MAG TPA: PSD1 and planctomycete cytochrome C domain-containing protein [Pirellulaceae bacterium]